MLDAWEKVYVVAVKAVDTDGYSTLELSTE